MPSATSLLLFIAALCVIRIFADVYTDHRQTCRRRQRAHLATTTAAVHRHNLEEGWRAMGGSGGRR